MTHPRTALVIGGGIAGPVAAMALQRAGIQATVYEAHPRSAEGIGIFLTLASNGIDALRTIEADTRALAAGHPTPGIQLRSITGKHLGSYTLIFGKRAFFGYVLAPDAEVWWFANVPRRDEPARGEVEAIPAEAWQRRLADLYAKDAGPAVRLVEASDPADIKNASPIHSIPHLPRWHRDRMVVIGDAAHAPTPTSGQGASLAIEDAVVLAKCLRDLPDPQQAFARFEALRRSRVERIIKVAARINSNKAPGPVAQVFRDAVLPVILRLTANSKQVNQHYRYHIDWNTPTSSAAALGGGSATPGA